MAEKKKSNPTPVQFVGQVRQEARKVVWPSSRETITTTILVLFFTVLMGVFFFFVDWVAANGTQFVLSFGTEK